MEQPAATLPTPSTAVTTGTSASATADDASDAGEGEIASARSADFVATQEWVSGGRYFSGDDQCSKLRI